MNKLLNIGVIIQLVLINQIFSQSKLTIRDICIGLIDSSHKSYIKKFYKNELFHIQNGSVSFLYQESPSAYTDINFIVVKNEDSIKKYFSEDELKYNGEKLILTISITSVLPDSIYIDANMLILSAGAFNTKRKQLMGFLERIKLVAFYKHNLGSWIVQRIEEKCIKCPDK